MKSIAQVSTPRRARRVAGALGAIGLFLLLLASSIHAQSLPGFRAPEKPKSAEVSVQAKAARGEAPLSRLYSHLRVDPSKIKRVPAPDPRKVQKEKGSSEKRLQIGVVRSLGRSINPLKDGPLYQLAEGDVRLMGVVSEGARRTRVRFTGMSLPAGARVFVYSMKNPDDFYGPYVGHGPSEDGTFWTPPMEGDGVVIEYFTPNSTTNHKGTPFKVTDVSHILKDVSDTQAGACNLEVTAQWANVATSVGRLQFTSGGGEFLCTGTLLNNSANDQNPYLLTANHCFRTQTEAQTLRVHWNYNTGDDPPPGTQFTDGSHLLATGTASDFTFVRLTGSLPGGLFFSGWSASPVPVSTSVTGIHHPDGSHKRISFGSTNSNCLGGLPGPCANFTHVGWSSGTTEPGSSGSGLWTGPAANPQLVGTLTGGAASCSTPTGNDEYGSFSATFPNISSFLTQSDCVTSISPTGQTFPASSELGSVNVTAPAGCNWPIRTPSNFITINSGPSGSGSGTVSFLLAPNTGPERLGSIVIGQKVFIVTQASGDCPETPINFGQTVNGTLTTGSCVLDDNTFYDAYTFNGVAGQQVSISMSSNAFDTFLFLLRPDDSVLTTDDDGGGGTNSRIPAGSGFISLPVTGTYTIFANAFFEDDTGAYSLTLNGLAPPPPSVRLSASTYSAAEGTPSVTAVVNRTGDTSGVSSVNYATSDTSGANNCNVNTGAASSRCDYLTSIGTVQFLANETSKAITIPIIDDSYAEGVETFTITLSNATGATLGAPASATISITNNDSVNGPNPIDASGFFVRQHYIDFLNREPDPSGFAFWTGEIDNCTPQPQCTEVKRINVSAAFFLSIEFQQTGYLVERLYKSSYGDAVGTSTTGGVHQLPVPIVQFNEFLPDTQEIGRGFVVGAPDADQVLENNKQAFIAGFVQRTRFTTAYPTTLTPAQFVDALFTNTGVTPSAAERTAAIDEFGGAGTSADVAARARALRKVAENGTFTQQESNRAFVLMEYFGYMRRNPNSAPDADHTGYEFWLTKLNQFGGNFIDAEMVKAFIISGEYRQRFGP